MSFRKRYVPIKNRFHFYLQGAFCFRYNGTRSIKAIAGGFMSIIEAIAEELHIQTNRQKPYCHYYQKAQPCLLSHAIVKK